MKKYIIPLLSLVFYAIPAWGTGTCSNTQVGSSGFTCIHANNSSRSGTNVNVHLINHVANSLLIIGVLANDSNSSVTFTISCTSGYSFSAAQSPTRRSDNTQWAEVFYFLVGSAYIGTDTCTVSDAAGTYIGASIVEYTGESTSPLDGTGNFGTASSGTPNSGSYSLTTGDLAIGFGVDGVAIGPGLGWNDRTSTGQNYNIIEDQIVSGGIATATASGGGIWIMIGVGFQAAGSGGGGGSTTNLQLVGNPGTSILLTAPIASGACATVVTAAVTGALITDNLSADFTSDPTSIVGYGVSISGTLTLYKYITPGNVNFKVCNDTAINPLTPGAATLQWRVIR